MQNGTPTQMLQDFMKITLYHLLEKQDSYFSIWS